MKFIKKLTFLLILLLSFFSIFSYKMTTESFSLTLNNYHVCYNTDNDKTALYSTTNMLGCFLSENQNYKVRNWFIGDLCGLNYNDINEKLTANWNINKGDVQSNFNGLIVKNLKSWGENNEKYINILKKNLWMTISITYEIEDMNGEKINVLKNFLIDEVGLTKDEILNKISKDDFNNIDDTKNYDLKVSYTIEDGKCPEGTNKEKQFLFTEPEEYIKFSCSNREEFNFNESNQNFTNKNGYEIKFTTIQGVF